MPWLYEALDKAQRYCAYTERCSHDLAEKYRSWDFPAEGVEAVIKAMKEEGFIDDTRFAAVFARSKNKHNAWGRNKIRAALKMRRMDDKTISEALQEIDGDIYYAQLKKQMLSKMRLEKEQDPYKRKAKLMRFGLSKGYEGDIVMDVIAECEKE